MIKTIEWTDDGVVMLDQRVLPREEVYLTFTLPEEVIEAIANLVIRGAPAIGVAAAMGMALGAQFFADDEQEFRGQLLDLSDRMNAARPTAVNLRWAVRRVKKVAEAALVDGVAAAKERLIDEAKSMHQKDIEMNRAMGAHGAALVPQDASILTHCNAGALATAGYGTALGVVRAAQEAGKNVVVLADETRPFLQGARLTTWELQKDDIPVTLITDNMSGYMMQQGKVDCVVVGSDRIAANGDVANKIGTYMVAVLAKEHGIPFFVAAPTSTIDLEAESGAAIPIEERSSDEVVVVNNIRITPDEVLAAYPAFDVTPNHLVEAIITEEGVARAPYTENLAALCAAAAEKN
ncbi:MAG: S-methyl-5-thioribose-1-phosphate isomerase [Acidobacteria bacterium]|jgi:methylthioribose-1-phosphate isomerase|nr:S-methyl-5-thioribose-1-phosphate isomerase [Acidobacteriota bacterium]|tara:strand:+ start:1726 stop:2775 length:1050 start_codon:yes stop_codon:yes gene_type:complete